jgi:outer membrane protein assembly factor BamE (lipoprotein component of BamABCDE complex)
MLLFRKYHKILIMIKLFILSTACQLQESTKIHGILYLENRIKQLKVNEDNTNDVIKLIGQPHTKSIENNDTWIYVERILTRGSYHKLGKEVLKTNNVAVLKFDKFGVLKSKKLYDKEKINKINFNSNKTENNLNKKSFVEKFLSSVKAKMYGNK